MARQPRNPYHRITEDPSASVAETAAEQTVTEPSKEQLDADRADHPDTSTDHSTDPAA
jgi:hypothetical protein